MTASTTQFTLSTMNTDQQDIKREIREKYGRIVSDGGCGCGSGSCCGSDNIPGGVSSMMVDTYDTLAGHEPDADLSLGCGIPARFAAFAPGETVVDLGSGAGNDAFVARHAVGEDGEVIGLDMTEEMVARAGEIAVRKGYINVRFELGDIEDMPLSDAIADIVISNCTLNLVPDKARAFAEMRRITRPGGRFCISDIVTEGRLPESVRSSIEAYVGCVAGAVEREEYLQLLRDAGFEDVNVQSENDVPIPDELRQALSQDAHRQNLHRIPRILSVTVTGTRP